MPSPVCAFPNGIVFPLKYQTLDHELCGLVVSLFRTPCLTFFFEHVLRLVGRSSMEPSRNCYYALPKNEFLPNFRETSSTPLVAIGPFTQPATSHHQFSLFKCSTNPSTCPRLNHRVSASIPATTRCLNRRDVPDRRLPAQQVNLATNDNESLTPAQKVSTYIRGHPTAATRWCSLALSYTRFQGSFHFSGWIFHLSFGTCHQSGVFSLRECPIHDQGYTSGVPPIVYKFNSL